MLPRDFDHTPYYCEENVWRLSKHPALGNRPRYVVFISNSARTCALWNQRACTQAEFPVIWDYHVILVVACQETRRGDTKYEVFDPDSTAGLPLPAVSYLSASFPYGSRFPKHLLPQFRILDAVEFRNLFASDRSHMRHDVGSERRWIQPPPPWPAIQVAGQTMNLEKFIHMGIEGPGMVTDLNGFRRRFAVSQSPDISPGSKSP